MREEQSLYMAQNINFYLHLSPYKEGREAAYELQNSQNTDDLSILCNLAKSGEKITYAVFNKEYFANKLKNYGTDIKFIEANKENEIDFVCEEAKERKENEIFTRKKINNVEKDKVFTFKSDFSIDTNKNPNYELKHSFHPLNRSEHSENSNIINQARILQIRNQQIVSNNFEENQNKVLLKDSLETQKIVLGSSAVLGVASLAAVYILGTSMLPIIALPILIAGFGFYNTKELNKDIEKINIKIKNNNEEILKNNNTIEHLRAIYNQKIEKENQINEERKPESSHSLKIQNQRRYISE